MTVFNTIKKRRSIRRFKDKQVEESKIKRIIDAARWAPSASNRQGWKYIIVTDMKVKRVIREENAAYFIEAAPVLIVVLYDNRTDNFEYKDHIQSAAASIQNILLTAEELGLGTCWINNMPPKRIMRRILGIPNYFDPIAIVALGYYEKKPKPLERKHKIEDIFSYNRFDFPHDGGGVGGGSVFLKGVLRKVYLNSPRPLKKVFMGFAKRFEKIFDTEERYK